MKTALRKRCRHFVFFSVACVLVFVNGVASPTNQPPVLNLIGDQTVIELQTLNFTVTATDDDPPLMALTASALPGTATFADNGNGNGSFDWTPNAADAAGSPYSVTFTATDGDGLFAKETILITVNVQDNDTTPPTEKIGVKA